MTITTKKFKYSALAKIIIPLCSAALIVGCNDNDSATATTPNTSNPAPSPQDPLISLPADAPKPSADQISISYVVDSTTEARVKSSVSDYNKWTLKCGTEDPILATSSDKFGPMWLVNKDVLASCNELLVQDEDETAKASIPVTEASLGKEFTVVNLGTDTAIVVEGSRQDGLLAAKGLPQTGTDVVLPIISNPGDLPTPPAGKIALQLYDPMGDNAPYDTMNLHLWGTDTNPDSGCSGLSDSERNTDWEDVSVTPDEKDKFGPIWYLSVPDTSAGCFKVIFRNANKDKLISSDIKIDISKMGDNRTLTFIPGSATPYNTRSEAFTKAGPSSKISADTLGAIMLDDSTMVWKSGGKADMVQIMFSHDGQHKVEEKIVDGETRSVVSGASIVLKSTSLTAEQKAKYPHLADYPAFALPTLPEGIELSSLVKGSLIAIGSTSDGELRASTGVQYAGALDALFAQEATELQYGPIYNDGQVTFRLWAPTATEVKLAVYNSDKEEIQRVAMVEDRESGSWSVALDTEVVDGKFYRYAMKVFQPRDQESVDYEVTDPYSVSLSTNSIYSQAIDLESDELKPSGWDSLEAPHSQKDSDLSDMVIYESHVRDFSARDVSTQNKGKYLAFTEQGTVPVDHLKQLSEAGMTHLHLMPVFDIATINEDPAKVADIDEDFSKLCEVNPAVKDSEFSKYCTGGGSIADAFAELAAEDSKDNAKVEALNEFVRSVDSFNWGYDPFHYTVPEGSYASNAEGTARILEFRKMVQSVKQDIGMNVVVDVVYNHTNASGLNDKSVLDKVVPLYYQRLVPDTGSVETSTCCDNTAPEHAMFAKLIDDSVQTWVKAYKIDAFRWDLMGHHPLAQMKGTLEAARKINDEVYFYGEGWNFGEVENDKRFVQATQKHLGGTGIGSFSDRLRDAVRGGSPFDGGEGIRKTPGFATGAYVQPNELVDIKADANEDGVSDELARALHQADLTRLGMAGNLKDFEFIDYEGNALKGSTLDYNGQAAGYAEQPWEVQNYVSKHDNQTLWDINMYKISHDTSLEDRVRMQALGMSTVLLGQAMPFNHMGGELLRSKSMQRDSYDYGDWYNRVDFTLNDNNWNKGLPAKDKDEANYTVIEKVLTANAQPSAANLEQMFEFYKELLRLRKASPLMTLPGADEIMKRVDFRNTGKGQTPGMIVMSIDNGSTQTTDLDSALDSIVIVINATPNEQTTGSFLNSNNEAIALSGFELSSTHNQANSIAGNASFANGKFTVPAWSSAVFVQPRGNERGLGLPVSQKADIPPFEAAKKVYVAGSFNGWNKAGTEAAYAGKGLYSATVGLSTTAEYKMTTVKGDDVSWYGCNGDDNCSVSKLGMYKLSLDATNPEQPVVLDAELQDDYTDVSWYIPGDISGGWEHDDARKMASVSAEQFSFTTPSLNAGTKYGFKFTGGNWGTLEHTASDVVAAEGSLAFSGSNNIEFTPAEAGTYQVSFNILTKEVDIQKQ
ncbi:pullulanase-type alpha-1,6-glucosidase [Photobacterium alginatilyticum]|uniref:pullulanase-type alpha-1,6-glucosidase n=1 Tax=Photobacterium alginatilyticum TaxID=1775171 RepID=UPI0030843763